MSPDEVRLAAMWPFVRSHLPDSPAKTLEIGCGPLGGFVPMLLSEGHEAVGIDPEAPEGQGYQRIEFERFEPSAPVDVVVASTSLHHVRDIAEVLDAAGSALVAGGRIVVLEWASERFDLSTAQWCFDRLPSSQDDEHGWLQHHRTAWTESGGTWETYFRSWREHEGMHTGEAVLRELDARFDRQVCTFGPYVFPDLDGTTADDEQAAIDANQITATGVQYVGLRPG
jgi:SAM-dependent methyltransferase